MLIPETPNVSLVAFYYRKPQELTELIQKIQAHLINIFPQQFTPYELEQVHSTVIGCEGVTTEAGIINRWYFQHQSQTKYMNFDRFLDYLNRNKYLPTTIRFGGYDRNQNYNFLSRGQHPYIRSFQLQAAADNTWIPVLIGWSVEDNFITNRIDNLRRDAQQFNLLHKYHATSEAIDNDFYLRLGTIQGELTTEKTDEIATYVRNLLEKQSSVNITLDLDNLAFVKYQDLSLPLATTEILPLNAATPSKIKKLFD
ncbi:MAG: hypothetical protein Tsb0014_42090 [Pleurocapsa sp.]